MAVLKNLLFLIFFLFTKITIAQFESDKIVLGGGTFDDNFLPPIPARNSIIYFNQSNGIDSINGSNWLKITILLNASSSSTWSRDTVMYVTNGYRIVNQRGQIIDSKILSSAFSDGEPGQLTGTQNVLFLSVKNNGTERLFLLYGEYRKNAAGDNAHDTLFSYAELNPYQSWPPSVALMSKNNILLTAADITLRGCIAACRHANGRDWWVVKPGNYSDVFYRGLVSPSGISVFERILTNVPHDEQYADGRSYFSVDGKKFINYTTAPGPKRVQLYDFDRCTGILSNPIIHDISSFLPINGVFPLCISPDGSKLYIFRQPMNQSQQPGIIQYDFETQQANYLGRDARIPFVSPNGKEVLMTNSVPDSTGPFGFSRYISIIKNPNEPFSNLNIEWDAINSINALALVPPNLAHFRLGAAQGTVCDSLGLSAEVVEDLPEISVFPNPSNGLFYLKVEEVALNEKLVLQMYDMQGRQVFQQNISEATTSCSTINYQLTQGLYFYQIKSNKKGWIKSGKLAVMR